MISYDEEGLKNSLNVVAATQDGKVLLHELMLYTRFNGDILAEGSQENTYANALLRRAYLYLRNKIDPKHLVEIEFNTQRKENDGYGNKSPDHDKLQRPRAIPRKWMGRKDKIDG